MFTAKNACPELDRPVNGGLVCLMRPDTSTERCSVKCNAGYQHILRPNLYEECGPSTNFRWTTEANMTPVLGCVGENRNEFILKKNELLLFNSIMS